MKRKQEINEQINKRNETKQNKNTCYFSEWTSIHIDYRFNFICYFLVYLNFNLFVNIDKTNQYRLNKNAMKMYENQYCKKAKEMLDSKHENFHTLPNVTVFGPTLHNVTQADIS